MTSPSPGGQEATREPVSPVSDGHPFAPYVTYQPTPYDAGITDDPELRWDQVRAAAEAEADI